MPKWKATPEEKRQRAKEEQISLFGDRFRGVIGKCKGIYQCTQGEVAKTSGMSPAALSRILSNPGNIKLEELIKLSESFPYIKEELRECINSVIT